MATMGIYKIDGPGGKVYVGSAVNIDKRWNEHRVKLHNNRHHSSKLQNAWNKYGESVFTFSILEIVEDRNKLLYREQVWLTVLFGAKEPNKIYNILRAAGSRLGSSPTAETRTKLSLAGKGRVFSEEHRAKLSMSQKGKPRKPISDETRAKISLALKGKKRTPFSDEHKQKISQAHKGTKRDPISIEHRAAISAANKGKIISEETKRKLSESHTGKAVSEETKRKLSEANKGKTRPPRTEEYRRKLSESLAGKKRMPHTEERKRKQSESLRLTWARRKGELT